VDLSAMLAAVQAGKLPFQAKHEAAAQPVATPWRSSSAGNPKESDSHGASLALEVYASVTAALASGEDRGAVLARHGVTAETFAQQARAWGARLQADPALMEHFKAMARGGMRR